MNTDDERQIIRDVSRILGKLEAQEINISRFYADRWDPLVGKVDAITTSTAHLEAKLAAITGEQRAQSKRLATLEKELEVVKLDRAKAAGALAIISLGAALLSQLFTAIASKFLQ